MWRAQVDGPGTAAVPARSSTPVREARVVQGYRDRQAYRPAHRLSDMQRDVGGRLAVRDALVRTRTGYIALTRALLRQHGWRVPTGSATPSAGG
jgi:transposase